MPPTLSTCTVKATTESGGRAVTEIRAIQACKLTRAHVVVDYGYEYPVTRVEHHVSTRRVGVTVESGCADIYQSFAPGDLIEVIAE
jgi:hypothetical protein